MAARGGTVRVSITGDARDLTRATREAEGSLKRLEAQSHRTGSGFSSIAKGAAFAAGSAGIYGLVTGLKAAFGAFKESERVSRQTEAVLKSTGHAANVTAKQVGDLATAISKKTGVDDEAVQSAENLLATFTNVRNEAGKHNKVFNETTRAAVDMSAALGTDAKSAAMQLGKALNDPAAGVSKLTRSGVTFTEQQKEQIKTLQESGNRLGAQKIILREVNKEFGGSAAATATSSAKLKVTFGNLAEATGRLLSPSFEKAAGVLNRFATQMVEGTGTGGRFVGAMRTVGQGVVTAFNAVKAVVGTVFGFISQTVDRNREKFASIAASVRSVVAPIKSALSGIAAEFRSAFGGGSGAGGSLRKIIDALISFEATVTKIMAAVFKRALPGIKQELQGFIRIVRGALDVIAGIFTLDLGRVLDGLKGIFSGAFKAVGGVIRAATAPLREAAARVGEAIKGGLSKVVNTIASVVKGAFSAVKSVVGSVVQFMKDRFSDALGIFESMLRTMGRMPVVGGKFRRAADDIAHFREELEGVNDKASTSISLFDRVASAAQRAYGSTPRGPVGPNAPQNRAGGGRIPGARVSADTVPVMMSPQEFVVTGDGESILEGLTGMPGVLNWLERVQRPHFAGGGRLSGYTTGFKAGLAGDGTGLLAKALDLVGEPHKKKSKTRSTGGSAGVPPGHNSVRAMLSRAQSIASRHLPYVYGGGHGGFSTGLGGYDCSGYVSNILGPGVISSPMAVYQPLASHLARGSGKYVTVGIRGTSAQNAHTMIRIGGSYFESGGGHGPAQTSGWNGTFDMYHPRGMRKGGRVGSILNSLKGSGVKESRALLKKLAGVADAVDYGALLKGVHGADKRAKGVGGKHKKALQGAAAILEGEYGRRLGREVGGLDDLTSDIDADAEYAADTLVIKGVDSESAKAKATALASQVHGLNRLTRKQHDGEVALARARATGNRKLARKVKAQQRKIKRAVHGKKADVATAQQELQAAKPTTDDFLSAATAQAALTTDLTDDRNAAEFGYAIRQKQYDDAKTSGDPRKLAEAADNLKSAASALDAIKDAQTQQKLNADNATIALAQLEKDKGKELDGLKKLQEDQQAILDEAKQSGDSSKIIDAANALKSTNDAIEALNESVSQANEIAQRTLDLQQQLADNQTKLLALASQGDQIVAAVVAAVNGGIGGPVGLGFQSPANNFAAY